MRRREFIVLFAGAGIAQVLPARAQPRVARVGILVIGGAVVAKNLALASELARMGYVEGRNITYELCAADGDLSRLQALARELVAAKPDVLIGASAANCRGPGRSDARHPHRPCGNDRSGRDRSERQHVASEPGFTSSIPTLARSALSCCAS